jgi:hypothetical protein
MRLLDPHTLDHLEPHPRPRLLEANAQTLRQVRHLCDKDRLLIELTLHSGITTRQLAVALNRSPGHVSRRLRSIMKRLDDPLVRSLTGPGCTLPVQHQQVGIGRFLHRSSIKQLMQQHDLSRQQITQMLEYIRGWHRGMSATLQGLSNRA